MAMLQSRLFTKTRRDAPKDEVSINANLLIRGGFIHKEMAGVYSYLPLGLRILKNIERIIRKEINSIGAQEVVLTALQKKEVWEKVGRWDDKIVDVWFKTDLKDGTELGLGFTHDEQLVNLLTEYVSSYKDLPLYVYQIHTKFRNELRAKSGIMRGREFVMKDLYSFDRTEREQDEFYEKVKQAYINIFTECGLGDITYFTYAGGGTFSQYSHEFQTLSESGEDIIYIDPESKVAINKEVLNDEVLAVAGLDRAKLVQRKAIEIGNIFKQGTKYTDPFGLGYKDENGEIKSIFMGGYGIGVTRLVGTIVEALADTKGIVWPESVAPFKYHLIEVLGKDEDENILVKVDARRLYDKLGADNVLYDERDLRAGEKFGDSDLIGIPWRVVVSTKTLQSGLYEVKNRKTGEIRMLDLKGLLGL